MCCPLCNVIGREGASEHIVTQYCVIVILVFMGVRCTHAVGPKTSQTNKMFASAVCNRGALLLRLQSQSTVVSVAFVHHHRERADLVKFLGLRRGRKANRHFREVRVADCSRARL